MYGILSFRLKVGEMQPVQHGSEYSSNNIIELSMVRTMGVKVHACEGRQSRDVVMS
jgi:hypothetical protein